jgi:hypothetical protein
VKFRSSEWIIRWLDQKQHRPLFYNWPQEGALVELIKNMSKTVAKQWLYLHSRTEGDRLWLRPLINPYTPCTLISINLSIDDSTALVDLGSFFQCFNLYAVGRARWTGDQPGGRPLFSHRTQNKRIQTSIPRVGFEPTITVFERPKTVHALDRVSTVIGMSQPDCKNLCAFSGEQPGRKTQTIFVLCMELPYSHHCSRTGSALCSLSVC